MNPQVITKNQVSNLPSLKMAIIRRDIKDLLKKCNAIFREASIREISLLENNNIKIRNHNQDEFKWKAKYLNPINSHSSVPSLQITFLNNRIWIFKVCRNPIISFSNRTEQLNNLEQALKHFRSSQARNKAHTKWFLGHHLSMVSNTTEWTISCKTFHPRRACSLTTLRKKIY